MASINKCSKFIRIVGTGLMGLGVVFQGLRGRSPSKMVWSKYTACLRPLHHS